MSRRVFFISDMKCKLGGGGGGVNYRLMKANNTYRLFPEAVFVFSDAIFLSPSETRIDVPWNPDASASQGDFNRIDSIFHFTSDDYFVVHSLEAFFLLLNDCPNIMKTMVVYHGQGGIYYEKLSFGEEYNAEDAEIYDLITKVALNEANYFAFPSLGAIRAFTDTQPGIDAFMDKNKCCILYNGCTPQAPLNYNDRTGIIDRIMSAKGKVFVSVASLIEQKGVERLPKFFKDYGDKDEDYLWVIIGNGVKRYALEDEIKEKQIGEHVVWETNPVDNNLILKIYERADFYILAHRLSIFDFATIEAMHMGCIPVLSRVGGNNEMIENGSGYFLDDDLDGKRFYDWMTGQNLEELKAMNRDIAKSKFSEQAMLEGYYERISKIKNSVH